MKPIKYFVGVFSLCALCRGALATEGIVTLTASTGVTNDIQITSSQSFKVLSVYDNGGTDSYLIIDKDGKTFKLNAGQAYGLVMAGPAVIHLGVPSAAGNVQSLVTMDIKPARIRREKQSQLGPIAGTFK